MRNIAATYRRCVLQANTTPSSTGHPLRGLDPLRQRLPLLVCQLLLVPIPVRSSRPRRRSSTCWPDTRASSGNAGVLAYTIRVSTSRRRVGNDIRVSSGSIKRS